VNLSDRFSMVYSGSQVTKGRARAVITATAMHTEIGKIAQALESKAKRNEKGFAAFWHRTKVILGVADTTPLQIKCVSTSLTFCSHHLTLFPDSTSSPISSSPALAL
jgi:magnesium-transporting ATPase (P-type)